MTFEPEQIEQLKKPLSRDHVKPPAPGKYGDYVEGWHVIAEANRIFGFDGWTRETVSMIETNREVLTLKGKNGDYQQWRVGYVAKVRVSAGGIVREGTGFGSGMGKPEALGEAIESAVKEAETDAMKRALMTFGNPFGLALYDKSQANVSDSEPEPAAVRESNYVQHYQAIANANSLPDLQAAFTVAKADKTLTKREAEQLIIKKDERKVDLTPPPRSLNEHLDNIEKEQPE